MSIIRNIILIFFVMGIISSCKSSWPSKISGSSIYVRDTFTKIVKFDTVEISILPKTIYSIVNKTFNEHNFIGIINSKSLQFFNKTDTIFFENIYFDNKLKTFFNAHTNDTESVILFQSYIEPQKTLLFFLMKMKKKKLLKQMAENNFTLPENFDFEQKKSIKLYFKFKDNKYCLQKVI